MSYTIEPIVHQPALVGEGPHWDADKKRLYFVDIPNGTIHSYNPEDKKVSSAKVHGVKSVSLIIPVEGEADKYLVSGDADIGLVSWDGVSDSVTDFKVLASIRNPNAELRINDGKCDPNGTLFAGTMKIDVGLEDFKIPGIGALYAFKNNELKKLVDGVKISNGLGWSADQKKFYFIDSLLRRVDCFDYDAEKMELNNRRTVFDLEANQVPGFPDGLTVDKDGNLWVALYEGSRVIQIDPTAGKLLSTVQLPTPNITSVAFGGENLDELYVTSASVNTDKEKYHDAGHLFKVTGLPTAGVPAKRVKI